MRLKLCKPSRGNERSGEKDHDRVCGEGGAVDLGAGMNAKFLMKFFLGLAIVMAGKIIFDQFNDATLKFLTAYATGIIVVHAIRAIEAIQPTDHNHNRG